MSGNDGFSERDVPNPRAPQMHPINAASGGSNGGLNGGTDGPSANWGQPGAPHDPFRWQSDFDSRHSKSHKTRNLLLVVFGSVFLFLLVICGGFGALAYLGIRQADKNATSQAIPSRTAATSNDLDALNQSLEEVFKNGVRPTPDYDRIAKAVEQVIQKLENGGSTPLSIPGFIAAIQQSPDGEPLGVIDRINLANNLQQHRPAPDYLADFRILNVTSDPTTKTFVADILFYSDTDFALSARWFFCEDNGQLKPYDFARLEVGRRTSDEWAAYMKSSDNPLVEGMQTALGIAADAYSRYENSSETLPATRRRMQRAEQTGMLEIDRPETELRLAWIYQSMGMSDEAVRLLERQKDGPARLGVLPSLAIEYQNASRMDELGPLLQQLDSLSPYHPNTLLTRARVLDLTGKREEAVDAWIDLVRMLPDDRSASSMVDYRLNPEQVGPFLDAIAGGRNPEVAVIAMVQGLVDRQVSWNSVKTALSQAKLSNDSFKQILSTGELLSQGRTEAAIETLSALIESDASIGYRDGLAQWRVDIQIESGSVENLLTAPNRDEVLTQIAEELINDEYYGNTTVLMRALKSRVGTDGDVPLADLIVAILSEDNEREIAIENYERYLSWARSQLDNSDFDPGFFETVLMRWCPLMAAHDRIDEVLRFLSMLPPENQQIPLVEFCVATARRGNTAAIEKLKSSNLFTQSPYAETFSNLFLACDARRQGDWQKADAFLVASIEANAQRATADTSYDRMKFRLVAYRANGWPMLDDLPDPLQRQFGDVADQLYFYRLLIRDAEYRCDARIAEWCRKFLTALREAASPEDLRSAEIAWIRLHAHLLESKHQRTAALRQWDNFAGRPDVSSGKDDDTHDYDLARAVTVACDARDLIAAKKFADRVSQSTSTEVHGWIDIESDDHESLLNRLQTHDARSIANWMTDDRTLVRLRQHPQVVQPLLEKHNAWLSDIYAATSVFIGFTEPPELDFETVSGSASLAFGDNCKVTTLKLVGETEIGYRIENAMGRTFTIYRTSAVPFAAITVPEEAQESIDASKSVLILSMIEADAEGLVGFWKFVRQFATPQSQFVYSDSDGYLRYGNRLDERLEWNEGLRIDAQCAGGVTMEFPPREPNDLTFLVESNVDEVRAKYLNKKRGEPTAGELDERINSLGVLVDWLGQSTIVPVELIDWFDDGRIVVKLKEPLQTEPIFIPGTSMLAYETRLVVLEK